MKAFVVLAVLALVTLASAEPAADGPMKQVKDFFSSVNPIILIAGGILLLVASGLAKLIAVVLILVGVIGLAMSFL